MGFYWIGFTLIWITFHQGGLTFAASLRSETLDFSSDAIDITKPQTEQVLPLRESNYYQKNNENTKHKTRFPHERRNRQIYTSKTYFGRSQLLELPRKYWINKEDKETAPLRMKTARYMYPEKHSKLAPHKSDITADNHEHIVPHLSHQIPTAPEQYDPNLGYAVRAEHGFNPGHDPNAGYESNPQSNARYGRPYPDRNANAGFGQDPGYDSDVGYVLDPEYDTHARQGQGSRYDGITGHGQDSGYVGPDSNVGPVPDFKYDSNVRSEKVFGYDSNVENGQNPRYNANAGHGQNPGFAVHAGQDNANAGYRKNYGHLTNVRYGHDPRQNVYAGYGLDVEENSDTRKDPKIGYGFGLSNDESKAIKSEKVDLKNEELKQKDDMKGGLQKLEKETSEHNLEVKESQEGKGKQKDILYNDDHIKILNRYNQLLQSEKYSDSLLNKNADTSSTVSNSDFMSDENLENDELFRHLSEENVFKQMPSETVDELEVTESSFSENFEGSGDIESFNEHLPTSDQGLNKSARILEMFSRVNDSNQCITPKNESGHCRGLTECPLLETMENFSSFLQYMCFQKGRLVGICCPDNPVIEISEKVDTNSTEQVKVDIQQPSEGCGLSTNTRIVGGTMSIPHEFSWMVALLRRDRFYCGGVIINNWYILTAAHCVLGIKVSDLKVRLGEFDFHKTTDHQRDFPVAEIKRHALFVTLTFQHDIAVLKLKRRIEYTKFIGSICLPNKDEGDFTARNATVVGWGTVSFGGSASPILRKVTVPVWDNKQCDQTYVFERINDAFMCAGSPENGEDACQGDSGGPLMTMGDDGRWSVIGIVSWGRRCGDPTYPGVYTRVTSYLDWIAENAQ